MTMVALPGSTDNIKIIRRVDIPYVKLPSGTIVTHAVLLIEDHFRLHEFRVKLYNSNLGIVIEEIKMPFNSKNYAYKKFNEWRNKLDEKSRKIAADIDNELNAKKSA